MDKCKPLPHGELHDAGQELLVDLPRGAHEKEVDDERAEEDGQTVEQGLTLVQVFAQRKQFLLDRGCIWGLFKGCLGGVRGY